MENQTQGFVQAAPQGGNSLTSVQSERAAQEEKIMMQAAKLYPRNMITARDNILNVCTRPKLAIAARYSYPRGGTEIVGPTIRLAEAIAQQWGNLEYGWYELERDELCKVSVCMAYAWDLEANLRRVAHFNVPHYRDKSGGKKELLTSDRDIYELCANMAMRRVRACLLNVIPGDIVEEAEAQCDATLAANADTSAEGVKRLIEAFEAYGVTRGQIETKLGRRLESVQPAQILLLRRIYAGIKDGMSVPDDHFEPEEKPASDKTGTAAAKEKLKKDAEKAKTASNPNTEKPKEDEQPASKSDAPAPASKPVADNQPASAGKQEEGEAPADEKVEVPAFLKKEGGAA